MKKLKNVLLILVDQQRFDTLGCMYNKDIQTPNIDSLAEDGIIYENAFCPFPLCVPSRNALLTGLYPKQAMSLNNQCTIPNGTATIPRELKKLGFKTRAIGKMHFTPTYLDVGFEDMELAEQDGPGRYEDDYHKVLKKNNLVDKLDMMGEIYEYRLNATDDFFANFGAAVSDIPKEFHSTEWIGERSVCAINNWGKDNERNFLMTGFIKPHHPFDPPEPYASMYDEDELTLMDGWLDKKMDIDKEHDRYFTRKAELSEKQYRKVLAKYYGTITHIDDQVGSMINALKEKGLYDDTLIIYTSDHGEYMGYHNLILKGGPMYESVMRIPLIVKYPKDYNLKGRDQRLSNNMDVLSTIMDVAGTEQPYGCMGLPLNGEKENEFVFAQRWKRKYMFRDKRYKLLYDYESGVKRLYDIVNDPTELNDLSVNEEFSKIIRDMTNKLTNFLAYEMVDPLHRDDGAPVIYNYEKSEFSDLEMMDSDTKLKTSPEEIEDMKNYLHSSYVNKKLKFD